MKRPNNLRSICSLALMASTPTCWSKLSSFTPCSKATNSSMWTHSCAARMYFQKISQNCGHLSQFALQPFAGETAKGFTQTIYDFLRQMAKYGATWRSKTYNLEWSDLQLESCVKESSASPCCAKKAISRKFAQSLLPPELKKKEKGQWLTCAKKFLEKERKPLLNYFRKSRLCIVLHSFWPPPGTMPSSNAALVAFKASFKRSYHENKIKQAWQHTLLRPKMRKWGCSDMLRTLVSLTSTSLAPPTYHSCWSKRHEKTA